MKWDSALYESKHTFVSEFGKDLLAYVSTDPTHRVLDLGCGTGTLTLELADRCGYVLGIDTSPEMIEKARKRYPHLMFRVLNALEMTYDNEWDVVFSNAVFHWIPNHDLLLNSISRALKKHGKLVCEFGAHGNIAAIEDAFNDSLCHRGHPYSSKFHFPKTEEFGALLTKNGFVIETMFDYDRPTPLQDGQSGLSNWIRQFFEAELAVFSKAEQDAILQDVQYRTEQRLWNGNSWIADYRRLRVVAGVE